MHWPYGGANHSQVGVDSGDVRCGDRVRKLVQPPLGLPFQCIFSPNRLVPVARSNRDDDRRVLRDEDFGYQCAVFAVDGLGERHNDVFAYSRGGSVSYETARETDTTHSRLIMVTGESLQEHEHKLQVEL